MVWPDYLQSLPQKTGRGGAGVPPAVAAHRSSPLHHIIGTFQEHFLSLKRKSGLLLIVFRLIDWLTGGDRESLWELHTVWVRVLAGRGVTASVWVFVNWQTQRGQESHLVIWKTPSSSSFSSSFLFFFSSSSYIASLTAHMHTSTLNVLFSDWFSCSRSWVKVNIIKRLHFAQLKIHPWE